MRRCALIVGLLWIAAESIPALADPSSLTLLFHVRPPYSYYDSKHDVVGILVSPVMDALGEAGITAEWIEMPPARQIEEIKRTTGATCALGWFKRPEREAFARFSSPIYHDQPTVVVARRDDEQFADSVSLQDSIRDASRELIIKTGYSYGATIDSWLRALQPHLETSAAPNEELLGMVAMHRADYVIMAPEEANYLLATAPELEASLRAIAPADAPNGELRYLMCSKSTPLALIDRINAGVASAAHQ